MEYLISVTVNTDCHWLDMTINGDKLLHVRAHKYSNIQKLIELNLLIIWQS